MIKISEEKVLTMMFKMIFELYHKEFGDKEAVDMLKKHDIPLDLLEREEKK